MRSRFRVCWLMVVRSSRPKTRQSHDARLLAVFLRQHRLTERMRPPPARHGCLHRALREGRARHDRGTTAASAPRNCSSPTGSATRMYFPLASAPPRFCGPDRRRAQHLCRSSNGIGRRCSFRCRPATACCSRTAEADAAISICRASGSPCQPARRCRRRSSSAFKTRFGIDILDGIGSTEMLHIFISNRPARSGRDRAAAGAGYEARVVDEDERPVPTGEIGNLLVKGDSIVRVLLEQHEKTKARRSRAAGSGPATSTTQDADGFFWYAGRTDDMLKVGGIWVSPVEVENALVEHPAVLECAVVGRADRDGLMKPRRTSCYATASGADERSGVRLPVAGAAKTSPNTSGRDGSSSCRSCRRRRRGRFSGSSSAENRRGSAVLARPGASAVRRAPGRRRGSSRSIGGWAPPACHRRRSRSSTHADRHRAPVL